MPSTVISSIEPVGKFNINILAADRAGVCQKLARDPAGGRELMKAGEETELEVSETSCEDDMEEPSHSIEAVETLP
jgi:hypothetical protein